MAATAAVAVTTLYAVHVRLPGHDLEAHAGTFSTLERAVAEVQTAEWADGAVVSVRAHVLDPADGDPQWRLVFRRAA